MTDTILDSEELSINIHEIDTNSLLDYLFSICSKNIDEVSEEDIKLKEVISKELKLRVVHPEIMV